MINKLTLYYLIICPILVIFSILFGICLINSLIELTMFIVISITLIITSLWFYILIWVLLED